MEITRLLPVIRVQGTVFARLSIIPAAVLATVASFLPWYTFDWVEPQRGSLLVAIAAVAALAAGLGSLFSAPRPILDVLTLLSGFVALFWSARYLGANSGDIEANGRVIPSGLQQGPVHLAIGASAVLTACGLLALYRSWSARYGHQALLPAPILAALVAAVLMEIVGLVAPFDSYHYHLRNEVTTVWDHGLGWLMLVDTLAVVALTVAGAAGSQPVVRRLILPYSLLTSAMFLQAILGAFAELTDDLREVTLGQLALAGAASCRLVVLVAVTRGWRPRVDQPVTSG